MVLSSGSHHLLQLLALSLAHSVRRRSGSHQPAFNRGGLTEGSAGIPVVDVAHQLRRKDRDDLYTPRTLTQLRSSLLRES